MKQRTPCAPQVLVVDDMPLMRDLVSQHLQRIGFEVVAVPSGEDAVIAFREQPDSFVAIVMDIQIPPGMNGLVTYERISRVKDLVPVVFWSMDLEPYRADLPVGTHVAALQKEASLHELVAVLERVIARLPRRTRWLGDD